jgi:hypothetical protein
MQRRTAFDCVRVARANVRRAAQVCAAADRESLQGALHLLEGAAAGMYQAEAEVRSGMPSDPAPLRREIAMLKRETSGMMRVIDGCAAVCRGLAVRRGCTAPGYTSQGRAAAAPSAGAACEIQG